MPNGIWDNIDNIHKFGYFADFFASLNYLEVIATRENWKYSAQDPNRKNNQNPILENYIHHTFKRLLAEYKQASTAEERNLIIYMDEKVACFNTGLFTPNYNMIYALFFRKLKETDKKPFTFYSFEQQASPKLSIIKDLPRRANYFTTVSELIYDSSLPFRANVEHILQENQSRFPQEVITPMLPALFTGAVEVAKKKVQANYKVAVPTYYRDEICLMLPICLSSPNKPDLALAIKRDDGFYTAKTCLTLDMAYNDARLIAKPDAEWLMP